MARQRQKIPLLLAVAVAASAENEKACILTQVSVRRDLNLYSLLIAFYKQGKSVKWFMNVCRDNCRPFCDMYWRRGGGATTLMFNGAAHMLL